MTHRYTKAVLTGLFWSVIGIIFFAIVATLLLKWTPLTEKKLQLYYMILPYLVLFIGGWISGRKAGEKGFLFGFLTGFLYVFLISIVQFLGFDYRLEGNQLLAFLFLVISSTAGGVLGVNIKRDGE